MTKVCLSQYRWAWMGWVELIHESTNKCLVLTYSFENNMLANSLAFDEVDLALRAPLPDTHNPLNAPM